MPRRLRIGTCVYCGQEKQLTRDHLISRSFFPREGGFRDNLPQVPACSECNHRKSDLENRIPALFQFAGDSPSSRMMFESGQMAAIMRGNRRLLREIATGFKEVYIRSEKGLYVKQAIIPLSSDTTRDISCWLKYIARGIYFLGSGKTLSKEWTLFPLNPPNIVAAQYLSCLIGNTLGRSLFQNVHQAWCLSGAESNDGVMLFRIEVNTIVQFVAATRDRQSDLSKTLFDWSY